METMAQAIKKAGDRLFTKRASLESLWQEIALHFYPERASFTTESMLGQEFGQDLGTSYPALVRRDLANMLSVMLRPADFAEVVMENEEPPDNAAREYLEWLTQTQARAMYARNAGFNRASKEGDHDFSTFGQCAISVEVNRARSDLLYRCWHLKNLAWSDNENQQPDNFHLKFKLCVEDVLRMFPKTAGSKVKSQKDKYHEINCRRMVVPVDSYEIKGGKKWGTPYVSVIINADDDEVLEETGSLTRVFAVSRWQTLSGSQYAYSPATIIALPDARMMQRMAFTLIEAGEKAVNPPLAAYKEVFRGDVDTKAGGMSWMDSAYDERTGEPVRTLYNDRNGLPVGFNMQDDLRMMINKTFFLDKINLPQQGNMTAYEFSLRMQEYIRQALPIFQPMEEERNGLLCDMTFDLLSANGVFADRRPPQSLKDKNLRFKFRSPLQSANDAALTAQFTQTVELLTAAAQMDKTLMADMDMRQSFRDAVKGTGAPAKWLNDEAEVEKAVAVMREREQQQELLAQIQQGAIAGEGVGRAAEAITKGGLV